MSSGGEPFMPSDVVFDDEPRRFEELRQIV